MKNNLDIFIKIGLFINTVLLISDRFIIQISDFVAIPIIIAGIVFMFAGFYRTYKAKTSDDKE